ncbi:MAG: phage major capsid protein [Alphaproteobacteria bacterium]|nr:phage major capsid protein [Alphaproteobacteria bacterium]
MPLARKIVSPSALAQLFTLVTVVKNVALSENIGATNHDFFQVLPDGRFSLLGRPLIVSDRCAALGTKGDIMLADLKSYLVGIRQNAELLVDTSIGFKESEIWFRLNCRVDGQPALAAAITPRVGSATLSPFVTLDTVSVAHQYQSHGTRGRRGARDARQGRTVGPSAICRRARRNP